MDLLECPFCQSKAVYTIVVAGTDGCGNQVKCSSCHALGPLREFKEHANMAWTQAMRATDPQHPIALREDLVRAIAKNLGCSDKLTEALMEHIFGAFLDKPLPGGAVRQIYSNRDSVVAFVAERLGHLWERRA